MDIVLFQDRKIVPKSLFDPEAAIMVKAKIKVEA